MISSLALSFSFSGARDTNILCPKVPITNLVFSITSSSSLSFSSVTFPILGSFPFLTIYLPDSFARFVNLFSR
ncbi:hypothetical protein [Pseudostreptobacillus hongkongensis]|uniref:hypothetical protein n=1 Tax=Pseudostreptobacillus hongkongensis TaxID=1162717 RepID=UPI0028D4D093|nr:hypothetical protein [Pseudostreptobacillus hongkongensis]